MFFDILWNTLFSKPEPDIKVEQPDTAPAEIKIKVKTMEEELSDIEQYLRSYPSNSFCYITLYDGNTHYNKHPLLLGRISLNDPAFRFQCGNDRYLYSHCGYGIEINLKEHHWNYYLAILELYKNIKISSECTYNVASITASSFLLHAYREVDFKHHIVSPLHNLSNFNTDTEAPKDLIDFTKGMWGIEIASLSEQVFISESLDSINEKIQKFCDAKVELTSDIVSKYILKLNSIIDQFPESCYLVELSDRNKLESMLSTEMPKQDITGSYRIDNILFRPDYFVLVPAIMYKISVTKFTRKDVLNQVLQSIPRAFIPSIEKYYKGA